MIHFQTNSIGTIFGIAVGMLLSLRFGILGLMAGIYLGNAIDKSIKSQIRTAKSKIRRKNQWNTQIIQYAYQLMGHIAKFDGSVSESSITIVENSMQLLKFNSTQKKKAKAAFNEGKKDTFNPFISLQQLQIALLMQPSIKSTIAGILIQLIEANSQNSNAKINRLDHILKCLGIMRFHKHTHQQYQQRPFAQGHNLNWAYKVLGASSTTEPDEIKRKYRKLLSDNHPDKVHAKKNNVTEEDIKKANEKTFEIKKAYTLIKSHLANSEV
ncbi:MAG: DnaJ domain-containing protein [Pseudomonadota bacterium]|nr:DnaJ domain-containing protein [Pseudomonadota bacterium]